jgi:RNA polymerase sigma-70 factor (ECF subfamily)
MDSPRSTQMQNPELYRHMADDVLVERCQEGDTSAFGELARRHRSGATKVAVSILRDSLEAEDEVQNALWKAYEHIHQFQRDAKFSTWLTRIVVNQCLMRLRQIRRSNFLYLDDGEIGGDPGTYELKEKGISPEEELSRTEIAAALQYEIRHTPPLLRHVFVLRDVQQLPMPEVARALGISVAAAKSRLLRARAELRSRMKRHCGRIGPAALMA